MMAPFSVLEADARNSEMRYLCPRVLGAKGVLIAPLDTPCFPKRKHHPLPFIYSYTYAYICTYIHIYICSVKG